MKAVCMMLHFFLTSTGDVYHSYSEKEFDSLDECRRWMYQQEIIGPIKPAVQTFFDCVEDQPIS